MNDIKDITESFKKENMKLIEELEKEDSYKNAFEYLDGIYKYYIKTRDNQDNIFHYAEVQLGLAKSLDFLLPYDHSNNRHSVNVQMKNVVSLAYQIFQLHINQCVLDHEDGACLVGGLNYARLNRGSVKFKTWPKLPMVHALNFSGKTTPHILSAGTIVYRVIDDKINWQGHWWLEIKPKNLKSWRSESAVSKQWNKGRYCAEIIIEDDIYCWKGMAATQAVPKSKAHCYLPGGEYQLWLDPNNLSRVDIKKWP